MKKDYQVVKTIREASGFGWDNSNYLLIAEDLVWDSYI
jgi:Myb/SANT-like DNA-binding domain